MTENPTTLRQLFARELPRLYAFAYQMSGNRPESERFLIELAQHVRQQGEQQLLAETEPFLPLLGILARNMEETLGRRSEHSFDSLDQILRSDLTRPIDLHRTGFANDPGQIHVMLWQLKRTCLTSVLGCLPPGVRLSFILTDLWGISPVDAANLLDIKESAYRVRLTRARKRVEDYLAPRCVHVDAQNPCTCTGRLMIAIDAGFVNQPRHTVDIPHEAHDSEAPRRDIGSLYRALPQAMMSEGETERLLSMIG